MNGPYTERVYRVESLAFDAKTAQQFANVFRRLFGLPILKCGWQAEDEVKRKYLSPSLGEAVASGGVVTRGDIAGGKENSHAVNCACVER